MEGKGDRARASSPEEVEDQEMSDWETDETSESSVDMSTSGDEIEDEQDSEDEQIPKVERKKKRKRTLDTSADFAAGLSRVLNMNMTKQEAQAPVMAKNRVVERRLEEERLERRARRALTAEKRAKMQQGRRRLNDPEQVAQTLEYEKRLKKVATRGVIQLFNAVRAHQRFGEDQLASTVVAETKAKEKEQLAKLSKASFLDRLKKGTTATVNN